MNEYKPFHLDLFSGIGGFSLAAQWAGFKTIQFVEIDKFCQKILKKHWPHIPIHGDITTYDAKKLRVQIDLLTGGFPCQPFSVAGKQLAEKDSRHLWPQMLRIIKECKPTWIVGENVAGIIRLALDQCLSDLEAEGYSTRAFIIPACAVNAPHRRDRVWIIAYNNKLGCLDGSNHQQERYILFNQDRLSKEDKQEWEGRSSRICETSQASSDPKCEGLARLLQPDSYTTQANEFTSYSHSSFNCINKLGIQAIPQDIRMDDGLPFRSHRIKALGNAIVPQVAYQILRNIKSILDIDNS